MTRPAPKPENGKRYWRIYKGCRCHDTRTDSLKPGRTCGCPVFIYVGKKRAKAMARVMETR